MTLTAEIECRHYLELGLVRLWLDRKRPPRRPIRSDDLQSSSHHLHHQRQSSSGCEDWNHPLDLMTEGAVGELSWTSAAGRIVGIGLWAGVRRQIGWRHRQDAFASS